MTIPVAEIPITDTYEDVKRLIYQICRGYVHTGLEFEELVSEANEAFVKAYKKYNFKRGEFTTLIHHAVNNHLKSLMKKRSRARKKSVKLLTNQKGMERHTKKITFTLHKFMDSLSEDSKFIVKLILDTPNDIKEIGNKLSFDKGKWTRFLKNHISNLGWDQDKVDAIFEEVRAAL